MKSKAYYDDYEGDQSKLRERLVEAEEANPDGFNYIDPQTGTGYYLCLSCNRLFELEDFHGGGECNFCHAVNKDD